MKSLREKESRRLFCCNYESAPKSRFFEIAWKVAKYYSGYMLSVQLFKRSIVQLNPTTS